MSKEQWGHGFHTGRKARPVRGYVGLWFFSVTEDAQLQYQGCIVRRIDRDHWAVQHLSWLDGGAFGPLVVIDRARLSELRLFESAASLRRGIHDYRLSRRDLYPDSREEDFDFEERLHKRISGST